MLKSSVARRLPACLESRETQARTVCAIASQPCGVPYAFELLQKAKDRAAPTPGALPGRDGKLTTDREEWKAGVVTHLEQTHYDPADFEELYAEIDRKYQERIW